MFLMTAEASLPETPPSLEVLQEFLQKPGKSSEDHILILVSKLEAPQ